MTATYYMLTTASTAPQPGTHVTGRDRDGEPELITTDPRKIRPWQDMPADTYDRLFDPEDQGIAGAVLGNDGWRLAVLAPLGDVVPDGDGWYAISAAGWRVTAVENCDGLLGPQAAQVRAALATAETRLAGDQNGPVYQAYVEAVNAAYEAGDPQADEHAAAEALDAAGADGQWWESGHSCVYGPEITALAARDLIGTTPGWTQDTYNRLTAPWAAAFGQPIHPADTLPAHAPAGHTAFPAHSR